jgi:hypothetical protein
VFPATALWWLDHYEELRRHLQDRYAVVARDDRTGVIFSLRGPAIGRPAAGDPTDAERPLMLHALG